MNLWQHQIEEIPHLVSGHRLLAWEPGTGKTRVTLEAFGRLKAEAGGKKPVRMLVIVPANVRYQWDFHARELAFQTQLIEKTTTSVDPRAEIVIVSYHGVIAQTVWKSAMKLTWDALTLDEAHYCKSPSTKWTKAIFGARKESPATLFKQSARVWMLTGTPIMNDPSDLWVVVSRVFPHLLTQFDIQNRAQWVQEWCAGYDTPYGFKVTGARKPELLNKLLAPHMSRVKKSAVLKELKEPLIDSFRLPPRPIKVDASLDPVLQKLMAILGQDDFGDSELTDFDPQVSTLRRLIGMEKAGEVAEFVREELLSHDKIIVFYIHTACGTHIYNDLHDHGAVIYNGKMSAGAKQHAKEAFINDPDCHVIVVQIQAGGTGTDGLQIAQRVIIAEDPWVPGIKDQIISRAHRGGQTGQVHATSVVIAGSFDERVTKTLERKARIVSAIIDGEAA
jgi:SNF2 family DNA or RNA helicase